MAIKQCSDGNPDGTLLGQGPTDKIGFYAATPVVQPVVATGATVAQLITALTTLGLIRNT